MTEIDFEQDSNLVPADTSLKTISALVEEQLDTESDIADLEAQLKKKNEDLKRLSEREIPAAMFAAGMTSFTLKSDDPERTGASIKVEDGVAISLAKPEVKAFVIRWLRDNGHGDLVSNEISTKVPKGFDATLIESIRQAIIAAGLSFNEAENVNTATFKSLYKEQKEKGVDMNPDDFGAYEYTKTVIKLPAAVKPKRGKK